MCPRKSTTKMFRLLCVLTTTTNMLLFLKQFDSPFGGYFVHNFDLLSFLNFIKISYVWTKKRLLKSIIISFIHQKKYPFFLVFYWKILLSTLVWIKFLLENCFSIFWVWFGYQVIFSCKIFINICRMDDFDWKTKQEYEENLCGSSEHVIF